MGKQKGLGAGDRILKTMDNIRANPVNVKKSNPSKPRLEFDPFKLFYSVGTNSF